MGECGIDLQDKVIELTATQSGCRLEEIKPDSHFEDDLGMDSLDAIELVMALEDYFNVEISDEDADTLKTVTQAVAYLEKKLKEAK